MIYVDAKVLGVNVDFNVIRQNRQHLDTREGRLPALLLVCGRDAHQAMYALLCAEHTVGVVSMHREGGMVDAYDLCLRGVIDINRPAAPVAVAQVHVKEHVAPVLGLEPALARRHRHDGVTVGEVVGEPAGKLKLG